MSGDRSKAFSQPFITRSRKQKKIKERPAAQNGSDPRYLTLRIDASRSQKELLDEIVKEIRFHRDRNRQSFASLQNQKKSRRRLDQYEADLKVWDMRKAGLTFRDIAKRLCTREYSSFPSRKNPIVQPSDGSVQAVREINLRWV